MPHLDLSEWMPGPNQKIREARFSEELISLNVKQKALLDLKVGDVIKAHDTLYLALESRAPETIFVKVLNLKTRNKIPVNICSKFLRRCSVVVGSESC